MIVAQATQGITPSKIALTIAIGSAFALFPILGTTTLLCLLAGVILRLNQPIIQLVNGICTPLHLPVIYGFIKLGAFIFRVPYAHVGIRLMNHMFWDDPREFWMRFGTAAFHAIVAWAIVAPFWITLIYCIAYPTCKEIARRRVVSADCGTQAGHPVP